jgi:hypothetical protein
MNQASLLYDIPVYILDHPMKCWEQFRFPKSRRRRIRKKWAANIGNWREITYDGAMIDVSMLRLLRCPMPEISFTQTPEGHNWLARYATPIMTGNVPAGVMVIKS